MNHPGEESFCPSSRIRLCTIALVLGSWIGTLALTALAAYSLLRPDRMDEQGQELSETLWNDPGNQDLGVSKMTQAAVSAADAESDYRREEFESAIKKYQAYLKTNPDDAKAWYNLGNCYSQRRLSEGYGIAPELPACESNCTAWAQAADAYEHAVRVKPSEKIYLTEFTRSKGKAKRYDEGHAFLNEAEALGFSRAEVLEHQALLYMIEENVSQALPLLESAKSAGGNAHTINCKIASCQMYLTNYPAALQTYQNMIKDDPFFSMGWLGMGNVYLRMGYREDARKSFEKAIETGNWNSNAAYQLGAMSEQDGDWETAVKHYSYGNRYSRKSLNGVYREAIARAHLPADKEIDALLATLKENDAALATQCEAEIKKIAAQR
jgi:tetratricopeptide (TPR) repeat protein